LGCVGCGEESRNCVWATDYGASIIRRDIYLFGFIASAWGGLLLKENEKTLLLVDYLLLLCLFHV